MDVFICAALSFIISVLLIPLIIKFCNKHALYDSTNERKIHSGNVPRLGGVGIVTAFFISSCLYIAFYKPELFLKFLPMIVAGLVIFAFGLIDDIVDLGGVAKFLIQTVAAFVLIFNDYRFTNILGIENNIFNIIVTYCWIIGMVNAYNLIDGHDALCGGLSFFVIITYGFFEFSTNKSLSSLSFILAASILGFLVYNKPKAKIFMGDGGSQFLGFILAVFPLYNTTSGYESSKIFLITLLNMIPLLDVVAAMWRRTREHYSFFTADKSHIHHKLMNLGYGPWGIITLLYGLQIFLCLDAVISNHIGGNSGYLIMSLGYIVIIAFFCIIHYTNRAVIQKHLKEKDKEKKDE